MLLLLKYLVFLFFFGYFILLLLFFLVEGAPIQHNLIQTPLLPEHQPYPKPSPPHPFVPLPSRMHLSHLLRKLLRLCRQLLRLFRQLPRLLGLLPRQFWLLPRLGNHEIFCYHVLPPIFKPLFLINASTGMSNQGRE